MSRILHVYTCGVEYDNVCIKARTYIFSISRYFVGERSSPTYACGKPDISYYELVASMHTLSLLEYAYY